MLEILVWEWVGMLLTVFLIELLISRGAGGCIGQGSTRCDKAALSRYNMIEDAKLRIC